MAGFVHDLRYSLRTLKNTPGFTTVTVLTLALGIGANAVMFSALNAVLLRVLPFRQPDQLVMIWETNPHISGLFAQRLPVRLESYLRWKDEARSFQQMAVFQKNTTNLTGIDRPERIESALASNDFFSMLGVHVEMGRTFDPKEAEPGQDRVAIISHSLFERQFGHDPNVLGRTLSLNEVNYRILGVLPASFHLPATYGGFDQPKPEVWIPLNVSRHQAPEKLQESLNLVIGRLKPGVSVAQARSEMEVIEAQLRQEQPDLYRDFGANVFSLHTEDVGGSLTRSLFLLQCVVGFVLLIACVNVANLLLTRAAGREKEIAIRVALGAGPGRVIRQVFSESFLLSLLGGAAGLLLARWGIRVVSQLAPEDIHGLHELAIDPYVLAFTFAVIVIAGLLFGLAPAFHAAGPNVHEAISKGARTGRAVISGRLRSLLVIAEISLALIPLGGAGLMIRTLQALMRVNPGFRTEHVLTAQVSLPAVRYSALEQQKTFCRQLLEALAAIPGVQSVSLADGLPMERISIMGFHLEGETRQQPRSADVQLISEDYFQTMGSALVSGRAFSRAEAERSFGDIVIVNQALGVRLWPKQNPIGKIIYYNNASHETNAVVIGVVANSRQLGLNSEERPEMYFPTRSFNDGALVMRTQGDPMALVPDVTNRVLGIDKNLPLYEVKPLTELVRESVAQQRFTMFLLIAFSGLALVLSAVGLYGVLSYTVAQRTQEIGVRMALGAKRRDVLLMVIREGLLAALIGIAVGSSGSLILARLIASLLFGVGANDPVTFSSAALLIAIVALLASYMPARRATKVDPLVALRYE